MDQETIERLKTDLEEAKGSYDMLIIQMQEEGIEYPYDKLNALVEDSFNTISESLDQMSKDVSRYELLRERNRDYLTRLRVLKGISFGLQLFFWHLIIQAGRRANETYLKVVAALGAVLSCIGTQLVSDDIRIKLVDPFKDKQDYDNYMELKDKLKKAKKVNANDIDTIYSINRNLFEELEKAGALSLNLRRNNETNKSGI